MISISDLPVTLPELKSYESLDRLSRTLDEIDRVAFEHDFGHLFRVGEVVEGLYEVRGVATGGQGAVYFVRHRDWDMLLAMKTPHHHVWSNQRGRRRYLQEAETWINLGKHPNVATAFYVREINAIPRIFVEYADSGTLLDILNLRGQRSRRQEVDIAIQLIDGLDYVHANGLVHRDLKPNNVLVWSDGSIKITDFGLSAARTAGDQITAGAQTGTLIGTPRYMAPEQWMGAQDLENHADFYALGIILYELFARRFPYETAFQAGVGLDLLRAAHTTAAPLPLHALCPDLPPALADAVQACLAKAPADRPDRLTALRQGFLSLFEAQTGGAYARFQKDALILRADDLNNRGISLMDLGRGDEARSQLRNALDSDPMHPEANYNLGLIRWRTGEHTDTDLVSTLEKVALRMPEARYHLGLCHLERGDAPAAVQELGANVALVPHHATGHKYLTYALLANRQYADAVCVADRTQQLLPYDVDASRLAALAHSLHVGEAPAPAAPRLAYEAVVLPLPIAGAEVLGIDCSDGRVILVENGRNVLAWDLVSGAVHPVSMPDLPSGERSRLHYLGARKLLLLTRSHGTVRGEVWDVAAACKVADVPVPLSSLWASEDDWCYQDDQLYFLGEGDGPVKDRHIMLCLAGADKPLPKIVVVGRIHTFTARPKQELLMVAVEHQLEWWKPTGVSGSVLYDPPASAATFVDVIPEAGSSSSRVVAGYADGRIRLWDLLHDGHNYGIKLIRAMHGHTDSVRHAALNTSGSHLASAASDGTVRIWDAACGRCLRTLPCELGREARTGWLDDHTVIAYERSKPIFCWRLPTQSVRVPLEAVRPKSSLASLNISNALLSALQGADLLAKQGRAGEAYALLRHTQTLPDLARDAQLLGALEILGSHGRRVAVRSCWLRAVLKLPWSITALAPVDRDLLLVGIGRNLELWNWQTGERSARLGQHGDDITFVYVSANGKTVATMGGSADVRVWDLERRTPLFLLSRHGAFKTVSVNDACTRLVSADASTPRLVAWDIEIQEPILALSLSSPVAGLQVSPNKGTLTIVLKDGDFLRSDIDGRNGSYRGTVGKCDRAVVSPSGNRVAITPAGSQDAQIFDISNLAPISLTTLEQCREVLFWDGDSKTAFLLGSHVFRIQSLLKDGTPTLFTSEPLEEEILRLALSDTGRYIFTGGADGTIRCWETDWDLAFS